MCSVVGLDRLISAIVTAINSHYLGADFQQHTLVPPLNNGANAAPLSGTNVVHGRALNYCNILFKIVSLK